MQIVIASQWLARSTSVWLSFNEMTTFKGNLEMDNDGNKFKKWFLKWDRNIAGIAAVIVFFTLLAFVIVKLVVFDQQPDEEDETPKKSLKFNAYFNSEVCMSDSTSVTCSSADLETIRTEINQIVHTQGVDFASQLVLSDVRFEGNRIEKDWLSGVDLRFRQLLIKDTSLSELKNQAFSGDVFVSMSKLILSNTKIPLLTRSSFEGAYSVEILEINNADFKPIIIETNTFIDLSLQQLQLQNCIDGDALVNVTSSKSGKMIVTQLDLRNNHIQTLKSLMFESVPYLTTLFLSASKIFVIEPYAFSGLVLNTLDLRNNNLATLSPGTFDGITGISIANNLWRCDCDLVWFRDYFSTHRTSFQENTFQCSPSGQVYTNVDFCPSTTPPTTSTSTTIETSTVPPSTATTKTTTSMSTTETTTKTPTTTTSVTTTETPTTTTSQSSFSTTSTTQKPHPIIHCTDYTEPDISQRSALTQDFLDLHEGNIKIVFSLVEYDLNAWYSVTFDSLESLNDDDYLLWFITNTNTMKGCTQPPQNISNAMRIPLEYEKTYIFCLQNPQNFNVHPYDCAGLAVPPRLEDQTWIPNNLMITVISAISGTLLFTILLTGIVTFYCIRQHPSLIKGNKRVIIVESEAADAVVMPRTYDEISYNPPSLKSASNGYLTPKTKNYAQNRPVSIIFDSAPSGTALTSRNSKKKKSYKCRTKIMFINHQNDPIYEPPPLPPNHPLGRYNQRANLSFV